MTNSHDVVVSFAEPLIDAPDFAAIETLYTNDKLTHFVTQVLTYVGEQSGLSVDVTAFLQKPCALEVYVTDPIEGRALNLDARGKDYATNILSYPSELPDSVMEMLPNLPLGELVICHEVVSLQATEQGKTVAHHLTHLIVHGILHLLGFDHELGQKEQDEMEALEIAILARLGIVNPYE